MIRKTRWLAAGIICASIMMLSLSSCAPNPAKRQQAIIENTEGGEELLEREFEECDASEPLDENVYAYRQHRPPYKYPAQKKQEEIEDLYPHSFSSFDKTFPNRGSWRQSKEEIMDLVDRKIWAPELKETVDLLHYFDMLILVNTADRSSKTSGSKSAQRMQILVRSGDSNDYKTWNRIQVWPISSGQPCGKKIETPTGVFKFNPDRMYESYKSATFDNADMYETMFLFHEYGNGRSTGVAIHGTYKTSRLGRRDSGGCVRLYRENAKCLFDTLTGELTESCLEGAQLNYYDEVISLLARNAEADPEYFNNKTLRVRGYRTLVAIYNDKEDEL